MDSTISRIGSIARNPLLVLGRYINPIFSSATSCVVDDENESAKTFALDRNEQLASLLFSTLPAELRELIWEYTLADYEDLENAYGLNTCYRRPEHMGPRRTDTAILRTCQAIYDEAWFSPWTQARQTFFLTSQDRQPRKTTDMKEFASVIRLIEKHHPDLPIRRREIANAQVFAQCYVIGPCFQLQSNILDEPTFMPKTITITFRHTDIWDWERDSPILIRAQWVEHCRFPNSVTCIRIQVESTMRRKEQVDDVSASIQKSWFFKRFDGTHLVSKTSQTPQQTLWEGSSTWHGERWIMDEDEARPGLLSYYCLTIPFHPISKKAGMEGYDLKVNKRTPKDVHASSLSVGKTADGSVFGLRSLLGMHIKRFEVPNDMPKTQAVLLFNARFAKQTVPVRR